MTIAAGPFAIAASLLVIGGALKAHRPADTAHALRLAGARWVGPVVVRVFGVAEAGIGLWALVAGDRAAALAVGASYLAFCGFLAVALARELPIASCGCFGKADTPPSAAHLVVNSAAVAGAIAVVAEPGVGIGSVVADQPALGVPYLLLVVTGVALALTALTLAPRVEAATRASRTRLTP